MSRIAVQLPIRACEILKGSRRIVGIYYFETNTHIVLLDCVAEDGDYGGLVKFKDRHLEPESGIRIYPKSQIDSYRIHD